MKLSNNEKKVAAIKRALERNDGYCPCHGERSEDWKCPCKKMRDEQECKCGLYEKR